MAASRPLTHLIAVAERHLAEQRACERHAARRTVGVSDGKMRIGVVDRDREAVNAERVEGVASRAVEHRVSRPYKRRSPSPLASLALPRASGEWVKS